MRPGPLGVHMIGRHRRNAAPIIDAGANEARQRVGLQVRRRLDVHGRAEDQPRDGDGPQVLVERWFGRGSHARIGLGAEILDDDLLDMAVPLVDVADRQQRLDALRPRLADADQDAGRERHARAAGGLQRREPDGGVLVG